MNEKDNTYCRFLLARKFNIEKAINMIKEWHDWK